MLFVQGICRKDDVAVLMGNSNRSRVVPHEDVRVAQVLICEGYWGNQEEKEPKLYIEDSA